MEAAACVMADCGVADGQTCLDGPQQHATHVIHVQLMLCGAAP